MACIDVPILLHVVANKFDDWALGEITTRWSAINTRGISRKLLSLRSHKRSLIRSHTKEKS